jgi:hypothetical protein
VGSRLLDVDGHKLCVTVDGQRFRVVAEQELGLEPRGREPTPAEIATTAKNAYMTPSQVKLLRKDEIRS